MALCNSMDTLAPDAWPQGFHLSEPARLNDPDLQASEPDGCCAVVVRLAEWVDLGYRAEGLLEALIDLFSAELRAGLRTREFLELRMAEGFCAMDEEDLDRAIALLDFVLQAEARAGRPACWRPSRISGKDASHRKKGEYDAAMRHVGARPRN